MVEVKKRKRKRKRKKKKTKTSPSNLFRPVFSKKPPLVPLNGILRVYPLTPSLGYKSISKIF
jgi:hypothetical protein